MWNLHRCQLRVSFIDSTALAVCHPARIHQHRVFRVDARRGKTSVGWFFGFKLHLVVNDRGELLAFCLPPATSMTVSLCHAWCVARIASSAASSVRLFGRLFGRLFADKGYQRLHLGGAR